MACSESLTDVGLSLALTKNYAAINLCNESVICRWGQKVKRQHGSESCKS